MKPVTALIQEDGRMKDGCTFSDKIFLQMNFIIEMTKNEHH